MTEENNTDHDLLIRIDTKLDIYRQQIDKYQSTTDVQFTEVWKAIDEVRKDINSAKGFIAGSKFIWAFLGALPSSIVALFIGVK